MRYYKELKLCFDSRDEALVFYHKIIKLLSLDAESEGREIRVNKDFQFIADVPPKERRTIYDVNGRIIEAGVNDGKYYVILVCAERIEHLIEKRYITTKELSITFFDHEKNPRE